MASFSEGYPASLTNSCADCAFLTSADVKKAATKGELLGTIKHQRGFPRMPANAEQLDQADIDKIECWINNGMKD